MTESSSPKRPLLKHLPPKRDVVALLKFLSAPARITVDAGGYAFCRADRTRRVGSALVAGLVARGALRREGSRIKRTNAGTMLLRRLLAGEGAPHAEQHRERASIVLREGGGSVAATVDLAAAPIERLARQRDGDGPFLHPELVEAARRYSTDFERAMLRQRVTTDWDAIGGGGKGGSSAHERAELSDAAMAARGRFERAGTALGRVLRTAIMDVCCLGMGLEEVERRHGWPRRSGKMMLRAALEQLALHYRAPKGEQGLRAGSDDSVNGTQRSDSVSPSA